MIYLCCAYCACASYIFIIITRYLFLCAHYLLLSFIYFVHCSTLFILLFDFISSIFLTVRCSLFQREKFNSDPELSSGISILHTHSTSSVRVDKHHTADSTNFVLVLEQRTNYHHRHCGIDETNILHLDTAGRGRDTNSVL